MSDGLELSLKEEPWKITPSRVNRISVLSLYMGVFVPSAHGCCSPQEMLSPSLL